MHNLRALTCRAVLQVLYRGIRVLSHADSRVRQELLSLPEGRTVRFAVSPKPDAPSLTFTVLDGTIQKAPRAAEADIEIVFKNEKMAFRVFTGRQRCPFVR